MSQQRARRRIRYSIAIASLAGSQKCRYVSSDEQPLNTLQNSTISRLDPVLRKLMQRAKHFLSKQRGHHDLGKNDSYITRFS